MKFTRSMSSIKSNIQFPKNYPSSNQSPTVCQVELNKNLFILKLVNEDNRFNPRSMKAIQDALGDIEGYFWQERTHEQQPRALVTVGQGHIYSNGLDRDSIREVGPEEFMKLYHSTITKLLKFPIPTIAAINGHTFAGGAIFSIAHDLRVMRSDRGYFCMNEIDLAIPLTPGLSSIFSSKLRDFATFRNLILLGHRYKAQEALDTGLVDAIAPNEEVMKRAIELAETFAEKTVAGGEVYGMLRQEFLMDTIKKLESYELGFAATKL